jgi:L-lysine exporter family protein LysE/ArgO
MTVGGVISGILLGLGAAVPIGPVNVEIARRSLRSGMRAGASLGFGAVTVDMTYAVLCALGLRPLMGNPVAVTMLTVTSIVILLYLGAMSLRGAWRAIKTDATPTLDAAPAQAVHTSYVTGVLMTALNPMTLAFWFLVVPGLPAARDIASLILGVFLGTAAWVLTFSSLLAWLGRGRRALWITIADAVGGVVLLGFAGVAIWKGVFGSRGGGV